MIGVEHLSHKEKVFLAGCIRAVILSDGAFEDAELKDLDRLEGVLRFDDFEECLDEFEQNIPDQDGFMKEAAAIQNPETQDLILKTVYELSVQNGASEAALEGVFTKLRKLWEKG